jgi:hypothetical protein
MRRDGRMSTNVQFLGKEVPVKDTDSKSDYNVIFYIQELQFAMRQDGRMGINVHFGWEVQVEVSDCKTDYSVILIYRCCSLP